MCSKGVLVFLTPLVGLMTQEFHRVEACASPFGCFWPCGLDSWTKKQKDRRLMGKEVCVFFSLLGLGGGDGDGEKKTCKQ